MNYIESAIESMGSKTVVCWGAGRRLKLFLNKFCIKNSILPLPNFICDSTRIINEESICGVPVIDFDQVKKMDCSDTIIITTAGLFDLQSQVITNEFYYFPIYHCRSFETYFYLKENKNKLDFVMSMFADNKSRTTYNELFNCFVNGSFWNQSLFEGDAYFGNDLIGDLNDHDSFAFAGAFNGKHIDRALKNNCNININAFEPNKQWYDFLVNKYSDKQNVTIHNNILWDKRDTLKFDGDALNSGLDAHVVSSDDVGCDNLINSVNLDSIINEKVTLLALDVEGSECKALQGSANIIREYKPNLAICLYHNIEDFLELPILINELSAGKYKFYVKHHSCITAIETVLYAV
jgi:FkbM family methyltransferase